MAHVYHTLCTIPSQQQFPLPPIYSSLHIGWVRPLFKELHFSDPNAAGAIEATQQLQGLVQQLLNDHYSSSTVRSGAAVAGVSGEGSANPTQHQALLFTNEPQASVYELLSFYEEARCTNSWDRPAAESTFASVVVGAPQEVNRAAPPIAPSIMTTDQVLQALLRQSVSACFPNRPVRGVIFHFVEMDALKLATQIVDARVFESTEIRQFPLEGISGQKGNFQPGFHGASPRVPKPCLGCLVLRVFPYSCGLYSGWAFAGTID